MNPQSQNPIGPGTPDAEATLRLIAALPAPQGLEDRVHAALGAAFESGRQQPRARGRVLAWRTPHSSGNSWMRTAAAAAIALVVAGGGWGVYSRVQQPLPDRITGAPARISAPGGFGSDGAIRTPQTLTGPVLTHPPEAKKTGTKAAAGKATPHAAHAHSTPELLPQGAHAGPK